MISPAAEVKVREIMRTVLDGQEVVYVDDEAALEAVIDRLPSMLDADDGKSESESVDDIRDAIQECESELSSIGSDLSRLVQLRKTAEST